MCFLVILSLQLLAAAAVVVEMHRIHQWVVQEAFLADLPHKRRLLSPTRVVHCAEVAAGLPSFKLEQPDAVIRVTYLFPV